MVENIVGEGENAGYQHFLLLPQCFQKALSSGDSKVVTVWKGVETAWLDFFPDVADQSAHNVQKNPIFTKQYNILDFSKFEVFLERELSVALFVKYTFGGIRKHCRKRRKCR